MVLVLVLLSCPALPSRPDRAARQAPRLLRSPPPCLPQPMNAKFAGWCRNSSMRLPVTTPRRRFLSRCPYSGIHGLCRKLDAHGSRGLPGGVPPGGGGFFEGERPGRRGSAAGANARRRWQLLAPCTPCSGKKASCGASAVARCSRTRAAWPERFARFCSASPVLSAIYKPCLLLFY
ncbi:MAG: hypothetical protein JWP47_2511 [Polaromonas sp.]|nr:hypothetical protein [Polaromonas sp.]